MANLNYKGKRHLPLPKGPYIVGCTDIMTGNSTKGTFMRLYYPSSESGILEHYDRWPSWLPGKDYLEGYTKSSILPSFISAGMMHKYCDGVHIPAIFDAEPVLPVRNLPIVIFSHGLYSCRTTSSSIHVELASHGYVVAAIEHRDQSAGHTYYIKSNTSTSGVTSNDSTTKDKCEVPKTILHNNSQALRHYTSDIQEIPVPFSVRSPSSKYASLRNKQVHRRAEECSRALDLLRDINEGTAPRNVMEKNCELLKKFQGLFDLNKVALAGHSFGGATVLMGLATDPRFRVGLTLDAWMVPLEMDRRISSRLTQPILFIKSTNFYDRKSMKMLNSFQSTETERKYVTVWGTNHISHCDFPFMTPNILNAFGWGIIKGDIFTHLDIHNRLMMSFLSKHLDLAINAEYENYIQSVSSQIQIGIEVLDTWQGYLFATFLVPCIFLGIFASFLYWFRKDEKLSE